MGKTSRVGGSTVGASVVAANRDTLVTVGLLADLLSQLGTPLTLAGTAGFGAPSESASGVTAFVRPDVAVATKVLATGGVGVGNSAAGSTPGTCVKKVEIFDAAGVSLGFLAVYDAVT